MTAAVICFRDEVKLAASLVVQSRAICNYVNLFVLGGTGGFPDDSLGADSVTEVLFDNACALHEPIYCAQAVKALFKDNSPDIMVTVSGLFGDELAAQLALATNCGFVLGAASLSAADNGIIIKKSTYAGNLTAELRGFAPLAVSLYPDGSVPEARTSQHISISTDSDIPEFLHTAQYFPAETTDALADAQYVVAVGRGASGAKALARVSALSDKRGATLGCTRPVVCDGKLPREKLIGISGKRIAPKLCIAFGVSGSAAFMTGAQGSKTLIAVNKDPAAPIFKYCDYGVSADCGEFADALNRVLEEG